MHDRQVVNTQASSETSHQESEAVEAHRATEGRGLHRFFLTEKIVLPFPKRTQNTRGGTKYPYTLVSILIFIMFIFMILYQFQKKPD